MLRTCLLSIPLALSMAGLMASPAAAALDGAYLTGKWEVNSQGKCDDKTSESLTMHADGGFEYSRRGKAEAVGFWRIEDDIVVLDMMTSPASFKDIHAELQDFVAYQFYRMRAMPIDMQQDRFSAVASIGDRMKAFKLQRCQ